MFLHKEIGEALQRFVSDRPYSLLFAGADTNEFYKTFDRILIKDRHAKAEEAKDPNEAEEVSAEEK